MRIAFSAIVLAMLPAVLDQTILATTLPTIATDPGRLADVSWVVTAYVVAAAAAPLWGKLEDRHGRKLLLEVSLDMFLATSALSGAAQSTLDARGRESDSGFVRGRPDVIGTGLGRRPRLAAGARPLPGLHHGRVRGRRGAGAAAGRTAGRACELALGVLDKPALGLIALAGLHFRLPASEAEVPRSRLDLPGARLLATAAAALMLACIWGGQRYAWSSPEIVALLAVSALAAAGLVLRTRRTFDPIVPLSLIGNRLVALASAALFLVTAMMFAITVFVPLFLQTTTGATPTQAGLLLIPMMVGITVSTNVAGRLIERTGRYKIFPVLGLVLITTALASLAALAAHPSRGDEEGSLGAGG